MNHRHLAGLIIPALTPQALAQVPIQSIGTLPTHSRSAAAGISADGSTVFGTSASTILGPGQVQPVIWTTLRGLESLGHLGGTYNTAAAASADGSVIVGRSSTPANSPRAFRWTRKTGMQNLGTPPGALFSIATTISPDGSVIAGAAHYAASSSTAFRWTLPTGIQEIGPAAEPVSISADGNSIACKGGTTGFLWTAAAGLAPLPIMTNPPWYPYQRSEPVWLNPEGSGIIGSAFDTTGGDWPLAFRYSPAAGYQGFLAGEPPQSWWFATVEHVSPTGALIVGTNWFYPGQIQHIVVNGTPIPSLDYLLARGADFTGWDLSVYGTPRITGISADLRTFVGDAARPVTEGTTIEGWIVTLPAICYVNCDSSIAAPILTANDFQCFLNSFAAGDPYANCDRSTATPSLTANDFQCYLNRFAAGCT